MEKRGKPDAERLGMVAGTWPMVETKAKRFFQTTQGEEVIGSSQLSITDCGSGAGESSDPELVRAQGMELDLGRPNQMGPGPKPGMSFPFNDLGYYGNTGSKATEKKVGLSQEM